MHTLNDRLIKYCTEHNKEIPYGRHLQLISRSVMSIFKDAGRQEDIQKVDVTVEMTVNGYPDDAAGLIDQVIESYFTDRKTFYLIAQAKPPAQKYFNYDVEAHKAEAFEEALKKCGMEVQRNFNQEGIAQYKIPVSIPAHLVKLGKVFQKERWLQENRNHARMHQRKVKT